MDAEKPAGSESSTETPADEGAEKPATEKPAEEPVVADKPTETADLAKLRQVGTRLAKREARLQVREAAVAAKETKATQFDQIVAAFQQYGIPGGIKALGFHKDQVIDAYLAETDGTPPKAEDRVAAIEKRFADEQAARQRQQATEQEQRFRADVVGRIKADESLDLVNTMGAYDRVLGVMAAYHAKHGVIPSAIKAAKFVEAELEQEFIPRLARSKKISVSDRRTENKNAANGDRRTDTKTVAKGPSVTLTDNMADSVALGDDLPSDPDLRFNALIARMQ